MGVFFTMESEAFFSDLPIDFELWEQEKHNWQYIENLYHDCAQTCFIAMGCYAVIFTLSIIMFFFNNTRTASASN